MGGGGGCTVGPPGSVTMLPPASEKEQLFSVCSFGHGESYACRGIRLMVEHLVNLRHPVKVFINEKWKTKKQTCECLICDQKILQELENKGLLSFTSRYVDDDM